MGRQRAKKDDAASTKGQAIISRFFAPKPAAAAAVELSSARATPPPVPEPAPGTVVWPPPGRSKRSPSLQREGTNGTNGSLDSQHKSRKRRGLIKLSALNSEDQIEDEAGNLTETVDKEPNADLPGSDQEGLKSKKRRRMHTSDEDEAEFSDESSKRKMSGDGMALDKTTVDGNVANTSSATRNENKALQIPALDPARHAKFVNTLLAQADKNLSRGSFYGKPPSGNEKHTPLEQQVVELKAKYPDVLLMVEVGYRFRFFGDDAETASKVLGIVAHYDHSFLTASIPTFRLHVHVRRLVEAGYKVGVVKQTETAAIKAHGVNKTGPFTRDLSALYTKATLEAAEYLGGDENGEQEGAGRLSSYIMCIVEEAMVGEMVRNVRREDSFGNGNFDARFGVVAVETATGDVMHGHFMDTVTRTELEARLLACGPAELLLSSSLSSATEKLLVDYAGPASEVRVERVSQHNYKEGGAAAAIAEFYANKITSSPLSMEGKVDEGLEALMAMPEVVVAAFAHILCYLKQFNLENVLRLGATFRPFSGQQEMMLAPNALRQLEVLKNTADDSKRGSLLWLMDHTQTAFGARLLKYWITHPLRDYSLISARLDAVAEIAESMGGARIVQNEGTFPGSGKGGGTVGAATRGRGVRGETELASALFSIGQMPDVERGITRIYHKTATTSEFITVIRAIIGAASQFGQLRTYEEDYAATTSSEKHNCIRSALLRRLLATVTSPSIVDYANRLIASLNANAAATGDKLNLFVPGQYLEVDKCREAIKMVEEELEGFLPTYRGLLRIPNIQYLSVSGSSFLLEVPCAQRVPPDWIKINSTKKNNRYHPPEVLEALDRLALAKEELNVACIRAWDVFLTEFSSHYVEFRAAVQALAALDCLNSLAIVSCNQGYTRPEFVNSSETFLLNIGAGRHPVLDSTLQGGFVPNDTLLSGEAEQCQIITGPNMGGKSCYIRQVALITIMAQMGSYVPAASAKLHVFDAIHTRMGALDRIQRGSSTFFEELSEASSILDKATARSLVIMDELGRGTSTHDGVAIAYATLHHLLQELRCFTLFVTHYPKITELVQVFAGRARAYHVSYLAEEAELSNVKGVSEDHQNVQEAAQKVTFLYKLQPGAASRSFGIHVARLAMIPESCVARAAVMAAKFEKEVNSHAEEHSSSRCANSNEINQQSEELEKALLLFQQSSLQDEFSALKDTQHKIRELMSICQS